MKQTIYKKDTTGKIRFITVENQGIEIVQTSGVVGTDKPVEARKAAKPKNVGRANETTAEEQALKECEALIVDKLTKGYFNTIEEAQTEEVILPMLAKDFFKEEKKIPVNEMLIQEFKLDGIRLLIDIQVVNNKVKLITRQGKELTTVPHVIAEAKGLLAQLELEGIDRLILDGELYAGTNHTFQECMSLIKKEQPGQEILQYVVYDIVDTTKTYGERKHFISEFFNTEEYHCYPKNKRTICASPWVIDTKDNIRQHYEYAMSQGYEGLMVKRLSGKYKINGRSSELLKYKEFFDIQLPLLDVIPTDADPEKGQFVFAYETAENGILKCGMKFSDAECKEFLKNKDKYIGQTVEIRYFEETETGSLRFPVAHAVGFRLDK